MRRFDRLGGSLLTLAIAACARPVALPPSPTPEPLEPPVAISSLHLIPLPQQTVPQPGRFHLSDATVIAVSDSADAELRQLAQHAIDLIRSASGVAVRWGPQAAAPSEGAIVLRVTEARSANPEGYRLQVAPSAIVIESSTHAGVFYGLQTLTQLLPPGTPGAGDARGEGLLLPAVEIVDAPRFPYRGMHLDVGRHFFPAEFVKQYIDLLATYKLNVFHWHLTDDQGWRIEIKKYPRLTEVGSCRKETMLEKNFNPYVGDGIPYCGFYTQDEIRDVVAYARARYVTVIPEIEMPGHSVAALAAYPEYSCTGGPLEVSTKWGVTEDIFCPKEETFRFLEDVLGEVMALFPGRYIHIGGDEVPKARWRESAVAQEVIRRAGLKDEAELQSYFIRRIEQILVANGRRLIGWDEILEGGLAPEATVMSWRGMEGGIEAARQRHDVIMTPGSHLYFDFYQGDPRFEPLAIGGLTPLDRVYAFEPVPPELTDEEAQHVLGAQANVWTEYIATPDDVEYMVLPRMLALSEVVWSPKESRDWERFAARLPTHFRRLDALGVNYRVPHVLGLEQDRLTLADEVTVTLRALTADTEIRFTTDGSDPTEAAPLYEGPFPLPVDSAGVTVTARAFVATGRSSAPRIATFRRTTLRPGVVVDTARLDAGLRYSYYETEVLHTDSLAARRPVREGVSDGIGILEFARPEWIGLVFRGYVRVPEDGVYSFSLTSDDGSRLLIGDELVIDHDGPHSPTTKQGMIALAAGYHPVTVRFFQGGGGRELALAVRRDGDETDAPLTRWLFYQR